MSTCSVCGQEKTTGGCPNQYDYTHLHRSAYQEIKSYPAISGDGTGGRLSSETKTVTIDTWITIRVAEYNALNARILSLETDMALLGNVNNSLILTLKGFQDHILGHINDLRKPDEKN